MPKLSAAQQEMRRQKILAAAETCFTQSGFHRTSMQDICREAKVSAGSIYVYFDSKEALIEGLVELERQRVLADFAQLRDVPDFATGFALMMENCALHQSCEKAALFLEVVAESTRNPAVRATLQRIDQSIRDAMRELLQRLKDNGCLASAVPIDQLVSLIASFTDGIIIRRVIDPAFEFGPMSLRLMKTPVQLPRCRMTALKIVAALWIGAVSGPLMADEALTKAPIAPAVTVMKLQKVELVERLLVTGTLMPREEILIQPEIEGLKITDILVDEGDHVAQGQVLARLAHDGLNAQNEQWVATLEMSKAQIAQAQSQILQAEAAIGQSAPALQRAVDLLKTNAGTQAVVEQRAADQRANEARLANAKDGLGVAIADQANKQAQWNELKVRLARTEIRAPVAGLVSRRTARIGAVASALNDPMFRLIAKGEIELEAEVPELGLVKLQSGQPADISIGTDMVVRGTVRLVSTEVDKSTRLGKVRIAVPEDARIRIGSFAKATIEISRKMAVAVPVAALQYDGSQPYAQVVANGHITARKVTPGLMTMGMVEIKDGLGRFCVMVMQ
eukprot:gene7721-7782_t